MRVMSRTFSLGRLMIGVTAFCVLCGLAVNFPRAALACVQLAIIFAPMAIVWTVLRSCSNERFGVTFTSFTGAAVASAFVAASDLDGLKLSWEDHIAISMVPALGTLVFGGAFLALETYIWHARRRRITTPTTSPSSLPVAGARTARAAGLGLRL
jgi:hypothetical protein